MLFQVKVCLFDYCKWVNGQNNIKPNSECSFRKHKLLEKILWICFVYLV